MAFTDICQELDVEFMDLTTKTVKNLPMSKARIN